jgi:hypothetical protein
MQRHPTHTWRCYNEYSQSTPPHQSKTKSRDPWTEIQSTATIYAEAFVFCLLLPIRFVIDETSIKDAAIFSGVMSRCPQEARMSDQTIQRALEVKRRHEQELLRKANVLAVGVGYRTRDGQQTQEVSIVVSVKNKVPASNLKPGDRIPASLEGVTVDVVETGLIRAL